MSITGSRVVVTGGAGFIGSNLVIELIKRKCNVYVIDIVPQEYIHKTLPESGFRYFYADIREQEIIESIFQDGIDYVFHLAASFANERSIKYPMEDLQTNIAGTLNILINSLKFGVKHIVYASSSCIYGNANRLLKESMAPSPSTPYAASKLAGEYYISIYNKLYNLPTSIVRYFNVYGPNEYPGEFRNVIPKFFKSAMRKEPLIITGTGEETRDFTYISDAIDATIFCTEKKQAIGKTFNIGTGKYSTIKELAKKINIITNNPAGIKIIERRKWDHIINRQADISKIVSLGYKPKVELDDGLRKTYEWFRKSSTD